MKDWKLGNLHRDWNEYLLKYQGLNIKAPRSHLKTFFFFEALALRECKHKPGTEVKYFTGGDSMAIEKLNHIKDLATLPYFRSLLKGSDINNRTEVRFGNGSKIFTQGFGGKTRGGHPDYIILDDVIDSQVIYSEEANRKAKERLATEILPMAEPHTKIIIVGTLQREDDIYSIDFSRFSDFKWISKSYDAIVDEEKQITIFPEKWDWENLMAKKREIVEFAGEKWFNKEYRNTAVNLLGEIIRPEWKRTYKTVPEGLGIYIGFDLGVGKDIDKGDYSAGVVFAKDRDNNIYILDVWRERVDFAKRIRKIIDTGNQWRPIRLAIEDNIFQADTVQVARRNCDVNIVGVKTTKNKIEKFNQMLVPLFENGKVFFKEGDEKQELLWRELCSLPRGKYDDQCDALCIGLDGLLSRVVPTIEWF
jgi:predicted phage terminase large subunit-like protein